MKYQVMPDLTPIEYEALKADIAERGVLVPVEVDEQGDILDGHHRVKAWHELCADGVELPDFPVITRTGLTEEQKRNHARSLNVLRRHLSKDQRDDVMRSMRADGMSYRQIAKSVGVDPMTVYHRAGGVEISTPVTGSDGKQYPAQQERRTTDPTPPMFVTTPGNVKYWTPEDEPTDEPKAYGFDVPVFVPPVAPTNGHAPEPKAVAPGMAVHYSSETPEHYTPSEVLDAVVACMGGIDLDPCSNSHAAPNVPAATHYTKEDDGLTRAWSGCVFMNPPYGREIDDWIAKLVTEYEHGKVSEAIALVPSRTDTQWWQRLRDYHVCLVSGRLKFIGNNDPAPFPSAVFYLGPNTDKFVNAFEDMGDIWHRTRHGYCFGE